jgi:hypothetical protein
VKLKSIAVALTVAFSSISAQASMGREEGWLTVYSLCFAAVIALVVMISISAVQRPPRYLTVLLGWIVFSALFCFLCLIIVGGHSSDLLAIFLILNIVGLPFALIVTCVRKLASKN